MIHFLPIVQKSVFLAARTAALKKQLLKQLLLPFRPEYDSAKRTSGVTRERKTVAFGERGKDSLFKLSDRKYAED